MWVCVKSSKEIRVSSCVEKNIYQSMNYVLSENLHLTPSRYEMLLQSTHYISVFLDLL